MLCLLCLNRIETNLNFIKTNSAQWYEFDISKKLQKHFWSMNVHPNSLICLPCWQKVDDFHKFYVGVEEAHMNFYKIKVENGEISVECKEELTEVSEFNNNDEELEKDNKASCFLESEILIDQTQGQDMMEQNLLDDEGPAIVKYLSDEDLDNMPLNQLCKRRKIQNMNMDPLAKSDLSSFEVCRNVKHTEGGDLEMRTKDCKSNVSKNKEKEVDLNGNQVKSRSVNDYDTAEVNYMPNKVSSENIKCRGRQSCGKRCTKREENDKFIAEHFKQMSCDLCQEPVKGFTALQKHFMDIHRQRGYAVCCKRKYFNRRLLIDHIHCHINPEYFKCEKCDRVMLDRLRLKKHVLMVHSSEEVVKKRCCGECGKTFADAHYLRLHKLTHLAEEEKKFPCKECGKYYGSAHLLHRHMQTVHLKKFAQICYICGKTISSSTDYRIHMNKHEGIPQPIISCDICGLRVTTERGLKLHKETQHPVDGKKEHHCPKCPKVSPTHKALRKHIRTMHEKCYEHKCTICQKAFKRLEVLREHMATHTGTPLYTCPWCPKTFNSNGNMHAHRKKVHPKEWEEAKLQKYSANLKPIMANNT